MSSILPFARSFHGVWSPLPTRSTKLCGIVSGWRRCRSLFGNGRRLGLLRSTGPRPQDKRSSSWLRKRWRIGLAPRMQYRGRGCTCCRTTCKRRYGSQNDCYHFHPRIGRGRWSRSGPPWPPCMTCLTSRARRFSRGRCPELAAKYAANWQAHAAHSEPYQAKEKGYSETHHAAAETPKTDATAPIAGGFVASARSQVFHRPDCKSAAKISAKNLVRYASRDEAIQAGKKPCAECRP